MASDAEISTKADATSRGKTKLLMAASFPGLRAGEPLCFTPGDRELHARVNGKAMPVVRYSKAFRERLKRLTDRRYRPYSSKIRFILAWKGKEDAEETAIVLPDVVLRRD